MKKITFIALIMLMSLSMSTVFAGNANPKSSSDNPVTPPKTEKKLSDEQVTRLKARAQEIRGMDKTQMSTTEKRELRKENKEIKQTVRRDGGYIIIGGSTLLLVVILLIILL